MTCHYLNICLVMPPFRIQTKKLFLTYPQCGLSKEVVLSILNDVNIAGHSILQYIIARELHVDGQPHIHAYLELEKKIDCRSERTWDLCQDGTVYHPNVQSVRSSTAVMKYVTKDKDFISSMVLGNPMELCENGQLKEAIDLLWKQKYMMMLQRAHVIVPNLIKRYKNDDWKPMKPLKDYQEVVWDRSKSLVLWGPSNCGKTHWALSQPERMLMIENIDSLRLFKPDYHKGIIFDDMSFFELDRTRTIHLVDICFDRTIHCRYSNAFIPKDTIKIFLTNEQNGAIFCDMEDPAIKRRIEIISVDEHFILANTD